MLVDINPNIELPKYELVLCKLNGEPLQELHNIEDLEVKFYFANIDEISFRVPFYRMDSDGSKVENEIYNLVDGSMMVLVNGMKYFILTKPEIRTNEQTGEIYKTILGFSREYELAQKRLVGYEAPSRLLYDPTNQKDSEGLEKGFLNYITSKCGWKVGYVNANLLTKYRYLNFSKATYLQAFQEVQKTFGCLFKFDTINKVIDVYEITQLGKNQGLYISDRNFISSLNQTINHDEIKTRLYLYGNSNISVQSINITGQPYIESFSFYMNTKYMSQELIDALNAYEDYIATKEGIFNGYLAELEGYNDSLSTKKIELATLITELKVIESNLDIAISSGQSTTELKSQQTAKITEINNKQIEIDNIMTQINVVHGNIDNLSVDISLNSHLTEEQARELDPFIREDEYSDSNYTEDNIQELLDEGKKILERISYPNLQFTVDVEDFLSLVEGQHIWDNFILGDLVNLEHEELGFDYEVRLVGYVHNPDSNKLSLTFSNRNSVDDANIELKDLLEGLTTTASTVDFNRFKWDKGEQAEFIINEYVNSALNLAKQQILKADGQKPIMDERGIWLYKENPDGSIEDGQMRLIHNCLALTNDNWNTIEVAISAENGINANLVRGKLGQFAQVDANQITVGSEEQPLLEYIDTELTEAVSDLGDVINGAFVDTQLTNIEANSIKLSLENVTSESVNLISTATSLSITTEKTNYSTALTTLTNYLNTNWLGKTYPLEIDVAQRTTVTNYFKDLESKKTILINKIAEVRGSKALSDAKTYVDNNALKQNFYYNGVKIDTQEGFVATRNDDMAKTTVNATEGLKIQGKINGEWVDNFYVDLDGKIRARNMIIEGLDSGGNKIFNSTPTPPYKVNDLWKVTGVAGVDFRICTTARATGTYVASDWTDVKDSKDYADAIKNLTSGTSINGGVTTIDNTKIRVSHGSGQYSEMRADGFIRKWQYGEAEYLNGIYVVPNLSSDTERSVVYPITITLPPEFRGRGNNVEIILNLREYNNYSWMAVWSSGWMRWFPKRYRIVLNVLSTNFNLTYPEIVVNAYIYMEREYMLNNGGGRDYTEVSYFDIDFDLLVIGK